MARRLDYTITLDAPADQVYLDFTGRDYWQSLLDEYRRHSPQSELIRFHSDARGTDIVFSQQIRHDALPALARTVVPADLAITREQHFEPFDADQQLAHGRYTAMVPHAPAHFGGRYSLVSTGSGSQLRLSSVCKVDVPLIGGKIEELILHHIKRLFEAEEAFTADWIAARR